MLYNVAVTLIGAFLLVTAILVWLAIAFLAGRAGAL